MAPHRGIWLNDSDAEQLSVDLLDLWYSLTIPGRVVSEEMKTRVLEYQEYFGPGDEDGDRGHWPETKNSTSDSGRAV